MLPKKTNYDVVIVGSGLSGQVAAAQAGQLGLKALVVEQGRTTGGSGNYVEGIFAVGSKMQKEQGIKLTKEEILQHELEFSHYEANTQIWKDYLANSSENVDWMQEMGVDFTQVATLGVGMDTWHMFAGLGKHAIHEGLEPTAKKFGVEYVTSCKAMGLSLNADAISEVTVQDYESKEVATLQTKAVILASGGYLNNQQLLKYSTANANRIVPMNSGKSDGSGLELAWKVGAKKYRLGMAMMFGGQVKESSQPAYKFWKNDLGLAACEMAPLWVNEIGERFVDESVFRIWSHAGNAIIQQEKVYAILDQGIIDKLADEKLPRTLKPLSDLTRLENLKGIIADCEAQKMQFLTKADSIEELAEKLHQPQLLATVHRYNEFCEQKHDQDFEKTDNFLTAVAKGPFYAFELGVGAYCTMGGLRINRANQVLNEAGLPIEGLYAVGSDASGVLVGDTYGVSVPGSEAGYCVYSGRNAVQQVANKISK